MTILVKALGAALMLLPMGILINGYKLRTEPSPIEITDTSLIVTERNSSTVANVGDRIPDEETAEVYGIFSSMEISNSWDAHPTDCWCIWNNNEHYISGNAIVNDSNQAANEWTFVKK